MTTKRNAKPAEKTARKASKPAAKGAGNGAVSEETRRMAAIVDNAQTPIMMIDRDFVITYANRASISLLSSQAETLESIFPGFEVANLIGTCIDDFHKNPSHQRRLLADPNNSPYETDIQVGPLKFHIAVNAMIDAKGEHVGHSLEWSDVTEARAKEIEVARLESAVNGASNPLLMVNKDLEIVYANAASVNLLRKHEQTLRGLYPGFSVSEVIGTCIDIFHKNPAHQRGLLADPSNLPYRTDIQVGPLVFDINVNAIIDPSGHYIGCTLEWSEVTAQRDAQRQIEQLIGDATAGNLDERLESARYEGFLKDLSDGINQLLEVVAAPIKSASDAVSALAEGDVSARMDGDYLGEFARLRDAINACTSKLFQTVVDIRDSAGRVSDGAREISTGNQDLNVRTQQQAAALEECASTVEELTSTVKQNADNSREADQLAKQARDLAETGGQVVSAAVEAMGGINSASKKIADIIGVIDEIAFQTNLLALNAAVEAARAGEQGRGFAVVAAEVRNLAQRSAEAAKEIKSLINDSVEQVEEGSKLVDDSGAKLEEIVTSVKKVSEIISEIATASEEQATGIEQVNTAVGEMDRMTQQNAALVEEASSASEAMMNQAVELTNVVAFFRTGDQAPARDSGASAARRPAPSAAPAAARPAPAPARSQAASSDDGDEWEEF
ncbi:MAG: PAS domain-containing protein [Spirochaetaceae bacterium]|nr:PAS domain-containing protein [Spirochaetaceae bacterium]